MSCSLELIGERGGHLIRQNTSKRSKYIWDRKSKYKVTSHFKVVRMNSRTLDPYGYKDLRGSLNNTRRYEKEKQFLYKSTYIITSNFTYVDVFINT